MVTMQIIVVFALDLKLRKTQKMTMSSNSCLMTCGLLGFEVYQTKQHQPTIQQYNNQMSVLTRYM